MRKLILTLILFSGVVTNKILAQDAATNAPSKTTSRTPLDEGPDVWGTFDGRVPCQEMAKAWGLEVTSNCEKLKWLFTFFYDPKTHKPTSYKQSGSLYRGKSREGKWTFVKGIPTDPEATVIQLDPDDPKKSVYLLKGDDNVLFLLDQNKNLLVGDSYLSYTFNRVVN